MLLGPLPDQLPEMASPVTPRTVSTEPIRVAMEKVLKDKDLAYVSLSETTGLDSLGCIFGVGTKHRPPGYCLILHKVVLESM